MNKIWYINQSGKNKGPFTSKEVLMFKEQGLIKSFTLMWKSGMDDWKPFFEVEGLILPPVVDLPPVPGLPDLPIDSEQKKSPSKDQLVTNLLPDIPEEEQVEHELSEEEAHIDLDEAEEVDDYEDDEYEDDEQSAPEFLEALPDDIPMDNRSFPLFSSIAAGFFCLLIIGTTAIFFMGDVKKELIFKNVSLEVLKKLQTKVKTDKFFVNFGLDKSGEIVFAKSNLAADAVVSAKFELIKNEVHKDEVSFQSSSISRKGNIKFDDFTFNEGDKLVQGKYKVKIQAVVNDPSELLKNLVLKRPKKYTFEDTVFLIPGAKKDYLDKIEKLKINSIIKDKKVYTELEQKLQTVDNVITSIALHYRLSLGKSWGRYAGTEFEKRYARYAGPLLQKMILDDYEGIVKKSQAKVHAQQTANKVHVLAKDVSAWAADLKTLLDKYAKLNSRKRKSLRVKMEKRRDELKKNASSIKSFIKVK